jgi:hypothetical protein
VIAREFEIQLADAAISPSVSCSYNQLIEMAKLIAGDDSAVQTLVSALRGGKNIVEALSKIVQKVVEVVQDSGARDAPNTDTLMDSNRPASPELQNTITVDVGAGSRVSDINDTIMVGANGTSEAQNDQGGSKKESSQPPSAVQSKVGSMPPVLSDSSSHSTPESLSDSSPFGKLWDVINTQSRPY